MSRFCFVQLYIKVFTEDNSAKSILADERMTISDICQHLAEKNHIAMDISQCIIEHMPQLYLGELLLSLSATSVSMF